MVLNHTLKMVKMAHFMYILLHPLFFFFLLNKERPKVQVWAYGDLGIRPRQE